MIVQFGRKPSTEAEAYGNGTVSIGAEGFVQNVHRMEVSQ